MRIFPIIPVSARQHGFTIVELMVGILVGLILLAAVISVFVASVRSNSATLTMSKLNHEVRTVAEVLAKELRRSGFNADGMLLSEQENLFADLDIEASCVRYSYNRNVSAGDTWGFRLVGEAIELEVEPRTAITCANWGGVDPNLLLTDPEIVRITEFVLDTSGSRCYNLNHPNTGDADLDLWSWVPSASTEQPCDEIPNNGLASPGDLLVEHRLIRMAIEGVAGRQEEFSTRVVTEVRLPNNRRVLVPSP